MFTGIIECQGLIKEVEEKGGNMSFWIRSDISRKLKPDQSVSHDGVCLTVEKVRGNRHRVTAVAETLSKTILGTWQKGQPVNLERCLRLSDRLDGHFVQGHVDATGTCTLKSGKKGSWEYRFQFPKHLAGFIVEKGSVTVNGISLTAFNVNMETFDVAIIPYTYETTNISLVEPGKTVNLEFDVIGKYITRKLSLIKE